jgi:hypothetical protein
MRRPVWWDQAARPVEAWSAPWILKWGARIGGTTVAATLIYATGWWMGVSRTRFLGLPGDLIGPEERRTYEVVMLFPRWTAAAVESLAAPANWRAPLLPIALASIVLWRLRVWAVGLGEARNSAVGRGIGWLVTALGSAAATVLAGSVIGAAAQLNEFKGVLLGEAGHRLAHMSAPLALLATSGRLSLTSLMCGRGEQELACRSQVLGNTLWAVAGVLLWSVVLWRLLSRLAERVRWPDRAFVCALHVLLLAAVGLSLKALVEVHAVLLIPSVFPLVHQAAAATDTEAATESAANRVAYLGAGGGLHYLFDCDDGALVVRKDPPSGGWEMQGEVDVLRSALLAAGPLARWRFDEADGDGDMTDCGAFGCWTGRPGSGARRHATGHSGGGLYVPPGTARVVALAEDAPPVRLTELTLRAWVKLDSPTTEGQARGLASVWSSVREAQYVSWRLEPAAQGMVTMVLRWGRSGQTRLGTSKPFLMKAGKWYLLVVTLRSSAGRTTACLFVDGREMGREEVSSPFGLDPNEIVVGSDGRDGLGGVLDDVEVWTCALEPEEMKAIATCAEGIAPGGASEG